MKLLSIDPSSTRVGYALMTGINTLLEAGAFRPATSCETANERNRSMAHDLIATIREHKPDQIIIEDTGSHVHAGRAGAGAGLMVYGKAVGYFLRICEQEIGHKNVLCVEAQVWSRGIRKEKRQAYIAAQFRQYDPKRDRGFDISDAIALGQWFFARDIKPVGAA